MGLIRQMADEMTREIGNRTREFYEFVLPPVDMRLGQDNITVIVDVPGFDRQDISLSICGSILHVQACRQPPDTDGLVCNQRPNMIDKRLRLPVEVADGDNTGNARYENGVLTVTIPIQNTGRKISID